MPVSETTQLSLAVAGPGIHTFASNVQHTMVFTYTSQVGIESAQVKVEKQTGLAAVVEFSSGVTTTPIGTNGAEGAQVILQPSLAKGTYRIRFSIKRDGQHR